MKLVSFEAGGRRSFGTVDGEGVIDLGPRMPGTTGVADLLDGEARRRAEAAARGAPADYRLDEIAFLRPILWPEKTICIGVNYAHRNEEYDDSSLPPFPSVFMRVPDTLVGHGQPLLRPPESEQLDYEAEIAVVIGEGGRRIPRERALDHIAGLTCLNEGCIRGLDAARQVQCHPGQELRQLRLGRPVAGDRGRVFRLRRSEGDRAGQRRGPSGRHDGQPDLRFRLPGELRLDLGGAQAGAT